MVIGKEAYRVKEPKPWTMCLATPAVTTSLTVSSRWAASSGSAARDTNTLLPLGLLSKPSWTPAPLPVQSRLNGEIRQDDQHRRPIFQCRSLSNS